MDALTVGLSRQKRFLSRVSRRQGEADMWIGDPSLITDLPEMEAAKQIRDTIQAQAGQYMPQSASALVAHAMMVQVWDMEYAAVLEAIG